MNTSCLVSQKNRNALIIGGGIGGVSMALALAKAGWQVSLFERASSLRELGSGIVLSPNGMKALGCIDSRLPCFVKAEGATFPSPTDTPFLNHKGSLIGTTHFKDMEKVFGEPMIGIKRSDLMKILVNLLDLFLQKKEIETTMPDPELKKLNGKNVTLYLNKNFLSFEESSNGISARFEDGSVYYGDILVGCDGIRSKVRTQLTGEKDLDFLGLTSVRGITTFSDHPFLQSGCGFLTTGPGSQVFCSPLGKGLSYFSLSFPARAGVTGMLNKMELRLKIRGVFEHWHDPIGKLIENTPDDHFICADIYDLNPPKCFHHGRVVLMGDALHPMTPFMGQGANFALEDSVVLASCLISQKSYKEAFTQYAQLRSERVCKIVNLSHQFALLGRWENPAAVLFRNVMSRSMMRWSNSETQNKWLFAPKLVSLPT
jgi:2-polyprenyl-6-methoxyphenol hydroxylase-like FAD-dependent oxidoreductase